MIRKLFFTLAVISTASLSMVSAQQTAKVTASGVGYLEYLPKGYHSNSDKYPLVISLHGIKEKGTSSTDRNRVLADLPKVDNVGLPKYVRLGEDYPFILISPQLKSNMGTWSPSYIIQVLNYVKKHLRVDDRRIYLTGLSLGGFGVWRTAGEYPEVFAAIAPICPGGNSLSKADEIAKADLPIWGFHGSNDRVVSHNVTLKMINAVNSKRPNPMAKATIFQGMGHVIWDRAYNQTNLLSWMLSHRKGSAPPHNDHDDDNDDNDDNDNDNDNDNDHSPNKSPIVKTESDKTLVLPANSLYLTASVDDPDGKIESYKWTQVSGRSASLSSANRSKARAYNLKEGTYVFRLTVRDNDGASESDEMRVVVKESKEDKPEEDDDDKPSSKNALPYASAGPDRTITLPTSAVSIKAKASDKNGKIESYQWTQTYGDRVSLSGANTDEVRISNLAEGKFIFRLRVTDNDGGTMDDFFKITVKEGPKQGGGSKDEGDKDDAKPTRNNATPYAYAGPDRVIYLPTNSVSIQGKASDKDGRIVSYEWAQTYGGRASISGRDDSRVKIYNLHEGVYIFRLRVKDNGGKVRDDYFKITVRKRKNDVADNHQPNPGKDNGNTRPIANAGPDLRIKLSQGSIRLMGSAVDRDGKIVSYEWRKIAGPGNVKLKNADTRNVTVSNLEEGRYYFSLTVEDEDHTRHVDKMAIRVTGS